VWPLKTSRKDSKIDDVNREERQMSDAGDPQAGTLAEQLSLKRIERSTTSIGWMINMIIIVAGLISLIVVGGVVFIALSGNPIPEILGNWGGIILGFYFGQFITLVKDYITVVQMKQPSK
jgi:hypothetical protein